MVEKVLVKIGDPIKARAMMHKAVLHAVLVYGRKRWALTDTIMMVQEVFHHGISRRIAVMKASKGDDWERLQGFG